MNQSVGTSQPRLDGYEKVTGKAVYLADLPTGKILHARVVRARHGHARLLGVDTAKALEIPGVKAVVTGENYARRIGSAIADQYPIARDKVRYWGEPVAVVVATTTEAAEQAAGLVEVRLENLPVILHPKDAVRPDAALIHADLEEYTHTPHVHSIPGTNIAHQYRLTRGDVEKAFKEAYLVVENEYWVPWIAHVQIEPHGVVAQWDGERLTMWTSSQSPFFVRETLAHMFDLPTSRVRVRIPSVGGGFGGKSDVTIEPLMAVVAKAVPGLPIQLVLTREEVFFGTVVGRGGYGRVRHAVDEQGYLLAEEMDLFIGSGGYADFSVWISQGAGHNSTGPYYIPNLCLQSHAVYTNTPPTGAYRGYGHPEAHWMVERQMDQIARALKMDPVDLRCKNILRPGNENALGQEIQAYNGRPDLCLQTVADALGVEKTPTQPGRVRGQGLACFMKSPVMRTNAQSGAILRFNEDGSANLYTGGVEMGQGLSTVMVQIASDTLGIPADQINTALEIDTDFSPYEWQTVASHSTWAVGNAVRMAAEDALDQIRKAAAEVFDVPIEEIEIVRGQVYPRDQLECALPFSRFVTGYTRPDGSAVNPPVLGRGTFVPHGLTIPNLETGQGNVAASWTFGCQGVDLEVDLETGQVHILKIISVQDPGRVINPDTARGQVEGAMIMGMGAALMEKLHFAADGSLKNRSFVDYRILTSADVPELDVRFIQTEDASGPYGARGVGEHGITAVPPAIANALADAIGVDFYEIPITAERIYEALHNQKARGGVD